MPHSGHRHRNTPLLQQGAGLQGGAAAGVLRRPLLPVPPEPDGAHDARHQAAGKPRRDEGGPLAARRLHDAAQAGTLRAEGLRGAAGVCAPLRHRGQELAENLRHPVQREDIEVATPEQLGGRNADAAATALCRHRRLGLPQHLPQAAGAEGDGGLCD